MGVPSPMLRQMLLEYRRAHPLDFLETLYNWNYDAGVRAVGVKLLYIHARSGAEAVLWEWLAQQTQVRVIHVVRDNLLRQVVSLEQAFATGQWMTTADRKIEPPRIELPVAHCEKMFGAIGRNRAAIRQFFHAHQVLEVRYEAMLAEGDTVHRQLLDFLAVAPRPLSTELAKINSRPLADSITNYRELERHFADTEWAHFFDD